MKWSGLVRLLLIETGYGTALQVEVQRISEVDWPSTPGVNRDRVRYNTSAWIVKRYAWYSGKDRVQYFLLESGHLSYKVDILLSGFLAQWIVKHYFLCSDKDVRQLQITVNCVDCRLYSYSEVVRDCESVSQYVSCELVKVYKTCVKVYKSCEKVTSGVKVNKSCEKENKSCEGFEVESSEFKILLRFIYIYNLLQCVLFNLLNSLVLTVLKRRSGNSGKEPINSGIMVITVSSY